MTKGKIPSIKKIGRLIALLLFVIGFLGGWFITDYIVLLMVQAGTFQPICVGGVHIHHLYVGLAITAAGVIMFVIGGKRLKLWAMLIIGVGLGMYMSDFVSHLTWDSPFSYYC